MTGIVIPVKPFGVAKERLSGVLSAAARARLGRAVAAHTIETAQQVTPLVTVVTPDESIGTWAQQRGCTALLEPPNVGLNGAAGFAVARQDGPWLVLHADLPLLTEAEVSALAVAARRGRVLAPSHDGGTSAVGGQGQFDFAFGPGSFHQHLARVDAPVEIHTTVGLAIDLDDPHDLGVIRRHPAGSWIEAYLG